MVAEPSGDSLAQLRRGCVEHCVLALLRQGERYGFELARSLADHGALIASEGTIYPLLARLRKNGMVATTWRESPEGPPRRYYTLTAAGERAISEFAESWKLFSRAVDTIMDGMGAPDAQEGRGSQDADA